MVSNKDILSLIFYSEICERFSFPGLRLLLYVYLRNEYRLSYKATFIITHSFILLTYFFASIGCFISENIFVLHQSVIVLSALYLFGTALFAYDSFTEHSLHSILFSLVLISISSGLLKPSSFTLSHEAEKNTKKLGLFHSIIYYTIYISSLLSMFWAPLLADLACLGKDNCYGASFGISSLLLGISIALFLEASSSVEIINKPSRACRLILTVMLKELRKKIRLKLGKSTNEIKMNEKHLQIVADFKKSIHLLKFLIPVTFFWALYDQQYTSWIEQGLKMKTSILNELKIIPTEMPIVNSITMIILIPVLTYICIPILKFIHIKTSSTDKVALGLLLSAFSFFFAAYIEYVVNSITEEISILWQIPQYLLMALSEFLIGTQGLNLIIKQVPDSMKSVILAILMLTVSAGNLVAILLWHLNYLGDVFGFKNQIIVYLINGFIGIWIFWGFLKKIVTKNKEIPGVA